ncbi:MAG: ATP-binding protein [Phycisphaerales bacterium]
MMPLRHLGFRGRSLLVILGTCSIVLVTMTFALAWQQRSALRSAFLSRGMTEARIIASNTTAALSFDDADTAREVLSALNADPAIVEAKLMAADETIFARWAPDSVVAAKPVPSLPPAQRAHLIDGHRLVISEPVVLDDEQIGRLVVVFSLDSIGAETRGQAIVSGIVLVAALGIATLIGLRMQRLLSGPIARLVGTTERITTSGDYTIRADHSVIPEVDTLSGSLNRMLEEIESRGQALAEANEHLEDRVRRRTEDLSEALHQTESEIRVRQQVEQELRTSQQRAESANQAKSEFLANMSHEIRTPMTAILGYADILGEDGGDGAVQRDAVDTIRRNGQHLITIINDILDISKIEAGRMEVESIATPLSPIIEEVADLMRVRAEGKGIELNVVYEGPIPRSIRSDPTRIRQIVTNLAGNAIKFTETGSVTLAVSYDKNHEAPVRIDVRDTGIGIADDVVNNLFAAFAQADPSTTREYGGTGLGLVISRRLAELLGGSIDVASTVGVGSTFTVRLDPGPRGSIELVKPTSGAAGRAEPTARATTPDELSGIRVLVVEDGPDNQRLIRFHLSRAGAEVEIRENGLLGVETLLGTEGDPPQTFDVVLMDMQMPVMGGYEATERLREAGWNGPIVALTAHAMQGDREKCLAAGCDDYLTKPINRDTLLQLVARWSGRSNAAA